jgi:hypothetical protein
MTLLWIVLLGVTALYGAALFGFYLFLKRLRPRV